MINGVGFNGTEDITVPAAALTLTGTRLNPAVVESSLTKVGYLTELSVQGLGGISVGNGATQNYRFDITNSVGRLSANNGFKITVQDFNVISSTTTLDIMPSENALLAGGQKTSSKIKIGLAPSFFNN